MSKSVLTSAEVHCVYSCSITCAYTPKYTHVSCSTCVYLPLIILYCVHASRFSSSSSAFETTSHIPHTEHQCSPSGAGLASVCPYHPSLLTLGVDGANWTRISAWAHLRPAQVEAGLCPRTMDLRANNHPRLPTLIGICEEVFIPQQREDNRPK